MLISCKSVAEPRKTSLENIDNICSFLKFKDNFSLNEKYIIEVFKKVNRSRQKMTWVKSLILSKLRNY